MDTQHLRAILVKLQDRLSDDDRQRLHFFLADDIPRRIRDNPTLAGTLNLMQCLFDQDKINERDFTFLINAFDEIQCIDAVKLLREYKTRMQSNWLNQSVQSLASIMPLLMDEVIIDQEEEDKSPTQILLLNQINSFGNNNKIIDKHNTNINPVTITVANAKLMSSQFESNQPFYISSRTSKYFLLMFLLLTMILGILPVFFVVNNHQINKLTSEIKKKDIIILEEQRKTNDIIRQLSAVEFEKNITIEQLITEKSSSLIIPGRKFGSLGGDYFDDSLLSDFTCSHYLSGLVAYHDVSNLESYQFLYMSNHNNQNKIESRIHSDRKYGIGRRFIFKNEKIYKVQGQIVNKESISPNGTRITTLIITGLQFITREGLRNLSYDGPSGESFTEEFHGYTLGYATGRKSGQYINQLQFFWYRMT